MYFFWWLVDLLDGDDSGLFGPCVAFYRGCGRALGNAMRVSPAPSRAFSGCCCVATGRGIGISGTCSEAQCPGALARLRVPEGLAGHLLLSYRAGRCYSKS